MENIRLVLVQITAPNLDGAARIAETLIEHKKAACVNIVPKVHSIYWWSAKIETAEESLLIVKTRRELLDDIISLVKTHHPYDLPEIIALPICGGDAEYLSWLEHETETPIV